MQTEVAVSEAKARLTELVRRAEAGEDIVLTRRGAAVVHLAPVKPKVDMEKRRKALDAFMGCGVGKFEGPSERVTDFLYDENGMPG
ncbi:MAG: type II toxin-antitoxin system prevent-host-death family antitoxin [Pacificimonas sp.]